MLPDVENGAASPEPPPLPPPAQGPAPELDPFGLESLDPAAPSAIPADVPGPRGDDLPAEAYANGVSHAEAAPRKSSQGKDRVREGKQQKRSKEQRDKDGHHKRRREERDSDGRRQER